MTDSESMYPSEQNTEETTTLPLSDWFVILDALEEWSYRHPRIGPGAGRVFSKLPQRAIDAWNRRNNIPRPAVDLLLFLAEDSRNISALMAAAGYTEDETRGAWDFARAAGYVQSTLLGADQLTLTGRVRAEDLRYRQGLRTGISPKDLPPSTR